MTKNIAFAEYERALEKIAKKLDCQIGDAENFIEPNPDEQDAHDELIVKFHEAINVPMDGAYHYFFAPAEDELLSLREVSQKFFNLTDKELDALTTVELAYFHPHG